MGFGGGGNVDDQKDPHHITVSGRWPVDSEHTKVSWRIVPSEYKGDFNGDSSGQFSETRILPVGKYAVAVSIRPSGTIGSTIVSVSWAHGDQSKKSAKDFPNQGAQIFVTIVIK